MCFCSLNSNINLHADTFVYWMNMGGFQTFILSFLMLQILARINGNVLLNTKVNTCLSGL